MLLYLYHSIHVYSKWPHRASAVKNITTAGSKSYGDFYEYHYHSYSWCISFDLPDKTRTSSFPHAVRVGINLKLLKYL